MIPVASVKSLLHWVRGPSGASLFTVVEMPMAPSYASFEPAMSLAVVS